MHSDLDLCLAVLVSFWIGACLGVIIGGINRSAKQQEAAQNKQFRVPAAHREFEHECDAPYPRVGE
ncbi:hypothetical protein [Paraburkholderia caledonica]|uniref:hypothetical protein n=1 Tax=Paraburkholderia caledonica TaxID=134536 RepID=UPI001177B1A7|nr:hypothetical protein [Paraburkholderia caledonica]